MLLAIPLRIGDVQYPDPCKKQFCIYSQYRDIFDQLGVLLFPVVSAGQAAVISEMCDGLLLPGSLQDVNPAYYGREPEAGTSYLIDEYSEDRRLIDAFLEKDKPILGICAGLQELNVYFGGTLHQRIPGHNLPCTARHRATLAEDSFLCAVYGSREIEINSLHNQAIDIPAPEFRVSAVADDGTVEAVERGNVIAVQWHPEMIPDLEFFRQWLDRFFPD